MLDSLYVMCLIGEGFTMSQVPPSVVSVDDSLAPETGSFHSLSTAADSNNTSEKLFRSFQKVIQMFLLTCIISTAGSSYLFLDHYLFIINKSLTM